jgi:hypothetical protein
LSPSVSSGRGGHRGRRRVCTVRIVTTQPCAPRCAASHASASASARTKPAGATRTLRPWPDLPLLQFDGLRWYENKRHRVVDSTPAGHFASFLAITV